MTEQTADTAVRRVPITVALIIGAFVAILNETFLNIALTDLMSAFDVTETTVQWLTTGYLLVVGILMPVTALITGWFTTRQTFLGAMILFLAGTVICGFSPTFGILLVGRLIQALGSGLLLPVMMNTLLMIYPPEKRGGAMGLVGLVIMFAPAIGPTLSGLIVSSLSWRWLFYLVIPLALFSILFAFRYLKNVSELTKPAVDYLSILFSTIGFGGLVYGLGSGANTFGRIVLIAGVIALVLFIQRQLTLKEPMLNLRVFRYPMFTLGIVILILVMMTMFSTMILLPMYLQKVLLLTSFAAGLILLPGGLLNGLLSPVMGRLFDKFGPRWVAIPGLLLIIVSVGLFVRLSTSESALYLTLVFTALMIGISMVMMPVSTTGLNQLPKALYPHGTAVMNTLQQVAGGIGTAMFVGIMAAGQQAYLSGSADPGSSTQMVNGMLQGMHQAFFVALIIAACSFVLALFLKRSTAPVEEGLKQFGENP